MYLWEKGSPYITFKAGEQKSVYITAEKNYLPKIKKIPCLALKQGKKICLYN